MDGTVVDLGGLVYLATAQTWSPVALPRKSSHLPLFALLISPLRAFLAWVTSSWLALPCLLRLIVPPRAFLLALMSSFHHLLDLAQMVTFRVSWSSSST